MPARRWRRQAREIVADSRRLLSKEREVVRMLASGMTVSQMAHK